MKDLPGWLPKVTVWAVTFTVVFLAVLAWQHHREATRWAIDGTQVEIRRSADGHWHWPGRINGREVDFLIDTGATGSAIPGALARELGLPVVGTVRSRTAGGEVRADVVLADLSLQGGLRAERLRVAALPELAVPLLGLDVLGRLGWRQQDGVLRIDLRGQPAAR